MSVAGDPERVIATLTPSPARRWGAVLSLAALAVLLVLLALEMPPGNGPWFLLVGAAGLAAVIGAVRIFMATEVRIELTAEMLRDSGGRELARIAEICEVDRGAFAFKPATGFLLHLQTPGPRAWAPGLWWRLGRYVGVGGVTHRHEAKAMAEAIALLIAAKRDRP